MDHLCVLLLLRTLFHECISAIAEKGVRADDDAGNDYPAAAADDFYGKSADRVKRHRRRHRSGDCIREGDSACGDKCACAERAAAILFSIQSDFADTDFVSAALRPDLFVYFGGAAQR
ncbi:hypothetical protein D3C74_390480 [compost metagenome]